MVWLLLTLAGSSPRRLSLIICIAIASIPADPCTSVFSYGWEPAIEQDEYDKFQRSRSWWVMSALCHWWSTIRLSWADILPFH